MKGRMDQEPRTAAAPQPPNEQHRELYQPPEIAWEEEFSPIAASDPICQIQPGTCE